jgi:hypothetical protein
MFEIGRVCHVERARYCSGTFGKRHEGFVTVSPEEKPVIYIARGELVSILSFVMPCPKT